MKTFVAWFYGFPLGATAVVVAGDEDAAREVLRRQIKKEGLDIPGRTHIRLEEIVGYNVAYIISDGDY